MSIPSRPPRIIVPQTSSSSSIPSAASTGLDRLGLADRPLRVPAVDGGLLRLPPGPEPPDIGVGGEVPDRCVVVDRGQRVGEGPDPGVEPVGDRPGLPRRPLQRGSVGLRARHHGDGGPSVHAADMADQPGDVPARAGRHGGIEGTGVRHRRQRRGLPADRGHVVDRPGGTGVGHGRNVPVVGNLWS